MALQVGTAYFNIVPRLDPRFAAQAAASVKSATEPALREVNAQFATQGRSMGQRLVDGFGSTMRGIGRTLTSGVTVAAGAIAGVGAAIITKGFSRLTAIDDAQAKLLGLGHSAGEVQKIMQSALGAVKGTAFGLDEAATVAATAVAAGIKPGAELQRVLGLIADSATIAGTSMGDMGDIFNKVASSNKLTADITDQLNQRGIPIIQLLATSLHKSTDEVLTLQKQGKISFADFANAMQQGLGGAALKSGETLTGALRNVGAAAGRLGEAFLKPFLGPAKNVLGSTIGLLDSFDAKATDLAQRLASSPGFKRFVDFVKNAKDQVGPLLDELQHFAPILAPIAGALGGLASLNLKGALGPLGALLPTISPITGALLGLAATSPGVRDALNTILDAVRPLVNQLGGAFGQVLQQLLPVVVDIAQSLGGVLADALRALTPALNTLVPILGQVAQALGGTLAELVKTVGGALVDAVKTLAPSLPGLAKALGQVAVAVGQDLAAALEALAPALPALAELARVTAEMIAKIPPAVLAKIVEAFLGFKAVKATTGPLGELTGRMRELAQLGAKPFQAVSTAISGIGDVAATRGVSKLTAFKGILGETFKSSKLFGKIIPILGAVSGAFSAFGAALAANPIFLIVAGIVALGAAIFIAYKKFGPFRDVVDAVADALRVAFFGAVHAVEDALSFLGNLFSTLGQRLKGLANPMELVKLLIGGPIELIGQIFGVDIFNIVVSALTNLVTNIIPKGAEMLGGLLLGLAEKIGDVYKWFYVDLPLTIFSAVADFATKLVPKGVELIGGFLLGLGQKIAAVYAFFYVTIPVTIFNAVARFATLLVSKGVDLIGGLIFGAVNKAGDLFRWLGGLGGQILGKLADFGSKLWGAGWDLIDGLWKGLKAAWNHFADLTTFELPKFHIKGTPIDIGGGTVHLLPHLAKGAVAFDPMLALVGDAGLGNPEIIAPEKMLRSIVHEELVAHANVVPIGAARGRDLPPINIHIVNEYPPGPDETRQLTTVTRRAIEAAIKAG